MKTKKQKRWIIALPALILMILITNYLLDSEIFEPYEKYIILIKKISTSIFIILIILLIKRIIDRLIIPQAQTEGDQYNLRRFTRLVTTILILLVISSFLFQNLYAIAVSFGVISVIIGFALQAPIASFIAWIYIVFRRPYQVGDRVQISHFRGDVMEISYLYTILWECSGDYLGNDRRSGRTIHFPNSIILKDQVINYSGPHFPFIWNETAIQIAYTSDLTFVESCLIKATQRDFSEQYPDLPTKRLEVLTPTVYYRVNTYAWLEAVISYPVEPEDTTGRRNRILRYALPLLNEFPDKVKFPSGTNR